MGSKKRSRKNTDNSDHKEKSKKSKNQVLNLNILLVTGFIEFPELFDDLPGMIAALDNKQSIQVDSITNEPLKKVIIEIFKTLPLDYSSKAGWTRNKDCKSLSGSVLNNLLKSNDIKQPNDINDSETMSTRYIINIIDLITSFPNLKLELGMLFQNILESTTVDLSGIDNEGVKTKLQNLFKLLGLAEDDDDEDMFRIPSKKSHQINKILEYLINIFNIYCNNIELIFPNFKNNNKTQNQSISNNNSESSSSSSDEEDNESEDEKINFLPEENKRVIGPAMPPSIQFIDNNNYNIQYNNESDDNNDEDEDDIIGPVIPNIIDKNIHDSNISTYTNINQIVGVTPDIMIQISNNSKDINNNKEVDINKKLDGREEWMLTPGESKHMEGLTETFGVSRQFQAGKVAKKVATQLAYQREAERAVEENSEEFLRTQKILQEHREKRGPTLMDAHLEKKNKTLSDKNDGGVTRRPFDREKDVLSRRVMDKNSIKQLVDQAKDLDSRFDKGNVQRNFL